MLSRVATIAGAVIGWGSALGFACLGVAGWVDDETVSELMLLGVSVALICSAALVLRRHERPLGAAFEMGYDMGRKDAIREASGRPAWGNVSPIRRGADGSSVFERSGA